MLMKKFSLMMIALLCAVVTFAAGGKRQFTALPFTPAKADVQLGKLMSAKQAPKALRAMKATAAKAGAKKAKKAATTAAELAGYYLWEYATADATPEDPNASVEGTAGSATVSIAAGTEEGTVTISGMFSNDLTGTIDTENGAIVVEGGQVAGTSSYGDYVAYAMFYYEGDEQNEAGWYYDDIYFTINEDGSLTVTDWLVRVLTGGQYDGYSLTPLWVSGSTLKPTEAPVTPDLVVAPEGLEFKEYAMTYTDYDKNAASSTAYVGIDGNDVYIKGFSSYMPDALIKGTKDGNTVTFPANQYLGSYAGYDSYFMEEAVFTYDAEADTYTAEGDVYSVLGGQYIDVYATNPVLKGVVEVATTPADPQITALTNGQYGYYITFNVPNVDIDGNGLVSSKLSFIIYTDIEGEIAPLTFTSATHEKLTEDMTEIPYGFSDEWDIYNGQIYLNDLYSKDWNNIGIQSIYRGGGEENATEIQWYHIKDYAGPSTGDYTFNFNEMDVPMSATGVSDGDITEDKAITEGNVTLTISPSVTNTPNRFWSTAAGPQLRVYSGTLTFTVPEGSTIDKIVFNHNGKWGANTVGEEAIANDTEAKAATWEGEAAQEVVVNIAANSQINTITVTVTSEGGTTEEDVLVTLPEGVEAQEYTLVASGATSQGTISIRDTKLVAFDGNDVYAQGLAYYFPDAFVKGTRTENGQVAFPSGQFVGEDKYGKEYLVGVTVAEDYSFVYEPAILFNLDEESGVLSMVEETYYGESGSSKEASLYNYFETAVYTPGALVTPDLVTLPEGVETEAWTIDGKFTDSYGSNNIVRATEVAFDGTDIYVKGIPFYFEEAWMKGTIDAETGIATFPTGQFVGEDEYGWEYMVGSEDLETPCDIQYAYDAEAKTLTQITKYIVENGEKSDELNPYGYWGDMLIYFGEPIIVDPVTAPEGLETEAYLFTAKMIENDADAARKAEGDAAEAASVTFDFNTMDVATSSSESTDGDILKEIALTQGNVTLTISPKDESNKTENRFWSTANGPQLRVYSGTLTFEVPEGSSMTEIAFNAGKWNEDNAADSGEFDGMTWTGDAQKVVVTIGGNSQINSIAVTVKGESGEEPIVEPVEGVDYTFQMQVGFDGNDVYFKGLSDNTAELWLKGTLSEDGKTVTIPANQYMGDYNVLWFTFPYYFTAVNEDGSMADIVLNYDTEKDQFTTDQFLVLHDGKRALGEPYQSFYNVVITKIQEFAATPADPIIESVKFDGDYPKANFNIPAEDVDGNAILTSKLFYTVWIEANGTQEPFTVVAGEGFYTKATEDMTEVPYDYDDAYDIHKGGATFYFNPAAEVANWSRVGVQSIYYGGGERNTSNIVWNDGDITTGIANVNVEKKNADVIYDLQGRRVVNATKGLYIMDGKKVVVK